GHLRAPPTRRFEVPIRLGLQGLAPTTGHWHSACSKATTMKIAELKRLSKPGAEAPTGAVRGTEQQDTAISTEQGAWYKRRWVQASVAGGMAVALIAGWLIHAWSNSSHVVSIDRLQIATVTNGHFVRDVAAQGTVIAAVNPTLFSVAPGTVSYSVRAGDTVTKGQILATLDSPELTNEYLREGARLDGLNAALERQQIEIRRQLMTSKQQADLAQVAINAAERELKRAQWAWDQRAISDRDYHRSIDDVSTAKLNFEH